MSKFWIEPLTDGAGNRCWILFEHGQFHAPTAVIDDQNMRTLCNLVLGNVAQAEITDIGAAVKSYRKKHRYTQQQMADVIGISRNRLSAVEGGNANMTMETRGKILEAIGRQL